MQDASQVKPRNYTVRHPLGTYLFQYAHSEPFTATGRLARPNGGSVGRNPVIVQPAGQVLILDPRAIITLDGRLMYGPRDSRPTTTRPTCAHG